MSPARPAVQSPKFYDPNLPQKCGVGWFLFHMKCAVRVRDWDRAIIGWGEGGSPVWNWRERETGRVGSWGAIWWIRRLSWDGGQEHNALRCMERWDNIIRKYIVMNKTSYKMIFSLLWMRKYNDHAINLVTLFCASDFSTNDAIAAESFYISILWPPLHIKRCSLFLKTQPVFQLSDI